MRKRSSMKYWRRRIPMASCRRRRCCSAPGCSRQLGRPRDSVADLNRARPRLHEFSTVVEEFEANLELARAYRSLGEPRLALAAVERALGESEAVRSQSANPELRMQLEAPLRPAYDLKLDLLRESYERATLAGHAEEARTLAIGGVRDRGCLPRQLLRRRRGAAIFTGRAARARRRVSPAGRAVPGTGGAPLCPRRAA